jgi:hypothetical protein
VKDQVVSLLASLVAPVQNHVGYVFIFHILFPPVLIRFAGLADAGQKKLGNKNHIAHRAITETHGTLGKLGKLLTDPERRVTGSFT